MSHRARSPIQHWLDRPIPQSREGDWEFYPSHGDPPVTDTELQRLEREGLFAVLAEHYAERKDVYVGADMFVYYEEGQRNRKVSPDLFVCFGVRRSMRRVYKTWEEQHGLDVVLEVVSKGTWRGDLGRKRKLYAALLGVREYYVYDPEGAYLAQPVMAFRRQGEELVQRPPVKAGLWSSELLELELRVEPCEVELQRWRLDLYRPDGTRLLRPAEARREAEQTAREAEQTAREAEQAAREAEQTAREAEQAAARGAEARREAEEELRRVRAELERLRRQQNETQSRRLNE
jgi:Uma2 family endonuclease